MSSQLKSRSANSFKNFMSTYSGPDFRFKTWLFPDFLDWPASIKQAQCELIDQYEEGTVKDKLAWTDHAIKECCYCLTIIPSSTCSEFKVMTWYHFCSISIETQNHLWNSRKRIIKIVSRPQLQIELPGIYILAATMIQAVCFVSHLWLLCFLQEKRVVSVGNFRIEIQWLHPFLLKKKKLFVTLFLYLIWSKNKEIPKTNYKEFLSIFVQFWGVADWRITIHQYQEPMAS